MSSQAEWIASDPDAVFEPGSNGAGGSVAFIAEAYAVAAVLSAAAEFINAVDKIYVDIAGGGGSKELAAQLAGVYRELNRLEQHLKKGFEEILRELGELRELIEHNYIIQTYAQANTALHQWLRVGRNDDAEAYSYQAVQWVYPKTDLVYVTPFMHVVNVRLACIKHIHPTDYFCTTRPYFNEFKGYVAKLDGWIWQLSNLVAQEHVIVGPTKTRLRTMGPIDGGGDGGGTGGGTGGGGTGGWEWVADYHAHGRHVATFNGWDEKKIRAQANSARNQGIAADRERYGITAMQRTSGAWRAAFQNSFRQALVSGLLNRPVTLGEMDPDGLLVDGEVLPPDLDQRYLLLKLCCSSEFRSRIETAWNSFVNRDDGRLVQFGYQRLFERDPSDEEIAVLREVASKHGYEAYFAALLYSDEYERRYGRHAPLPGEPVLAALEGTGPQDGNGARRSDVAVSDAH